MPGLRGDRQERERAFHDQSFRSGTYHTRPTHRFYSITEAAYGRYEDRLRELTRSGARVLEYGCGDGSAAFMLAAHGANVTGIDISKVAIDNANRRAEREGLDGGLHFQEMDAEALEFPDASFDLICGTGILHHTDLSRSYPEIRRTLKPDGRALFVEPLGHNRLINLYRARTPQYRTEDEHPLLTEDLEFARAFFGSVERRFFVLTTLLAYPVGRRPAFRPAVRALERLDRALFRHSGTARRNAWLVVLELAGPQT